MSCHFKNLLLINHKIYVHVLSILRDVDVNATPSQPFSLRDASRDVIDVGYWNSKTHVQNIRERD